MPELKFTRLDGNYWDKGLTQAYYGDAGFDLHAIEDEEIRPGEHKLVGTGIAVEIPVGYVGLVCPRSGMAKDWGVTVLNAPGVVDYGYTGEVTVNLINHGEWTYHVTRHDKIAQIVPVFMGGIWDVREVASLEDSERGTNGHGSSGR